MTHDVPTIPVPVSVTVYEAGKNNAIKTATVTAPNTRFSDNIYYPGKAYEFYIYARLVPCSALWAHMFQNHAWQDRMRQQAAIAPLTS